MPFMRRPILIRPKINARVRRPIFPPHRRSQILTVIAVLAIIAGVLLLIILPSNKYLDEVASKTAVVHTGSVITTAVNDTVREKMNDGRYNYDYFVTLQHDANGNVTSISADMARINALSTEILGDVIEKTKSGDLDVGIPLGTLLGSSILLGRGPDIPVRLAVLTTSYATFRNEFESVGINQSKHQVILEIKVEVSVVLPWTIEYTEVYCEVLIAETIIVGRVPDTYLGITP